MRAQWCKRYNTIGIHTDMIGLFSLSDAHKNLKTITHSDWKPTRHTCALALTTASLLFSTSLFATPALISKDSNSQPGNNYSNQASISGDGSYIAFKSEASSLLNGDNNDVSDIFRHDRLTGTTVLVSKADNGAAADEESSNPSISQNGRYVVFESASDLLSINDSNLSSDVYLRDLDAGLTRLVSVTPYSNSGNGSSANAEVNSDGRYVAFSSDADNLVLGDDNQTTDIFLRDTVAKTTTRLSVNAAGVTGNGISSHAAVSDNGQFVAFVSYADNLVVGDINDTADVFLYNRTTATLQLVSLNSNNVQGNLDSGSFGGIDVSDDGRHVVFHSNASNLIENDSNGTLDIFLKDLDSGEIILLSRNNSGEQSNSDSSEPSISKDGRYVAFRSSATNLVTGATTNSARIYVFDTKTQTISKVGGTGVSNGNDVEPVISADGSLVAYTFSGQTATGVSDSENIYVNSTNNAPLILSPSTFSVPGDSIIVTTLQVSDANADSLTYEIIGGTDQALFTINSVGELSFLQHQSYAAPADSNGDNVYEVELSVADDFGGEAKRLMKIGILPTSVLEDHGEERSSSGSGGGSTGALAILFLGLLASSRRKANRI